MAPPSQPTSPEAAAQRRSGDRAKVLSVRLTEDEFTALTALATEVGVGPSTLARTLIRRGLPPTAGLDNTPASTADLQLPGDILVRLEALEHWVATHDPQR